MRRSDLFYRITSLIFTLLGISIIFQLSYPPRHCTSKLTVSGIKSGANLPQSVTSPNIDNIKLSIMNDSGKVSTKSSVSTPRFIIVILSAARNKEIRNMLRTQGWLNNTWTLPGGGTIEYSFLVGQDMEYDVSDEVEEYGDMVVWPGPDSYRNIVHKLAWFLGRLQLQHQRDAYSYDFLVKLDDDSYLNVSKLALTLTNVSSTKPWYGGECISNKLVSRTGKYSVDPYHYPSTYYPAYAAGAGYVLSAALVQRITSIMWRVPQFAVEDAYIGVVTNLTGTGVECLEGFYHQNWRMYSDVLDTAVLLHKVKLEDIKTIRTLTENLTGIS